MRNAGCQLCGGQEAFLRIHMCVMKFEESVNMTARARASKLKPRTYTLKKRAESQAQARQRIANDAAEPLSSTPDEHAALLDRDETKWSTLIRKLNLKID